MLKYAITFLITTIITAVLGFFVLHGRVAHFAKVGLCVSALLLVTSLMYDPTRRHSEI